MFLGMFFLSFLERSVAQGLDDFAQAIAALRLRAVGGKGLLAREHAQTQQTTVCADRGGIVLVDLFAIFDILFEGIVSTS